MNFGPETDEPASHAIMDKAHEYGINFFDTANVYGWGENRGRTETDHRQLVRPGRRPPGQDRPRHQDQRQHGRPVAQQRQAVGAEHPARLRRVADRACRPTTSTSTRCTTSTGTPRGTRSGRRWTSSSPGQDPLRRLVQLRRLEHRPGQRGRRPPPLVRAGLRAVDLQPAHPRGRAGGAAGRAGVRAGRHPVEPAARRPARRRAAQGAGGQPADQRPRPRRRWIDSTASRSARTRTCARSWARSRPTWRWPGC